MARIANDRSETAFCDYKTALDADQASIAEIAADSGFADQAHVTRELQRVIGLTPAKLRAELRRDRDGDVAVRLAAAFVRGYSR